MKDKIFEYEIINPLAVLSDDGTTTLELNLISFNKQPPKLDIRRWNRKHKPAIMYKGITLNPSEFVALWGVVKDCFKDVEQRGN